MSVSLTMQTVQTNVKYPCNKWSNLSSQSWFQQAFDIAIALIFPPLLCTHVTESSLFFQSLLHNCVTRLSLAQTALKVIFTGLHPSADTELKRRSLITLTGPSSKELAPLSVGGL